LRAELYIDTGDKEQNKAARDALEKDRLEIEAEFGEPLIWSRRDDIRASRIYLRRTGSIDDKPAQLEEYRDWFVEQALAIRSVFGPRMMLLALPAPRVDQPDAGSSVTDAAAPLYPQTADGGVQLTNGPGRERVSDLLQPSHAENA
jgi:hypothetical protein